MEIDKRPREEGPLEECDSGKQQQEKHNAGRIESYCRTAQETNKVPSLVGRQITTSRAAHARWWFGDLHFRRGNETLSQNLSDLFTKEETSSTSEWLFSKDAFVHDVIFA